MENKENLGQLLVQYMGDPEVRFNPDKLRFLGVEPDEVITFLTHEQVQESWVYKEIEAYLQGKDVKPAYLVINALYREDAEKYRKLAGKYGVETRIVDNPYYSLKTGLVLAAQSTVAGAPDQRAIASRETKLRGLGIPEEIIKKPGATLCPTCYDQLVKLAPEEQDNYERLGWLGKMFGQECVSCQLTDEKLKH